METVCGLLSPPKSPSLLTPALHTDIQASPSGNRRSRHHSEMSNPEMARFLEKEHLRDAEDSDYQLMEDLIQKRLKSSKDRNVLTSSTNESERTQVSIKNCIPN